MSQFCDQFGFLCCHPWDIISGVAQLGINAVGAVYGGGGGSNPGTTGGNQGYIPQGWQQRNPNWSQNWDTYDTGSVFG